MRHRNVVRIALLDPDSTEPRFVAMQKRPNGSHDGYLEFPGGGIEAEDLGPKYAIARELQEELHIEPVRMVHEPIASDLVRLEHKDETQRWMLYFGIAPSLKTIVPSSEFADFDSYTLPSLAMQMDRYADLRAQVSALDAWVDAHLDRYV